MRLSTLRCAALLGAVAVAAGAFGSHGLREKVPAGDLEIWQTAVRYQVWHALALLGCAALQGQGWSLRWATRLFVIGAVVFAGSLYGIVAGARWLGAVAPIGGTALIGGWVCLAMARPASTDQ